MDCPKCGFEAMRGATECERCGVIFAKAAPVTFRPRPRIDDEERVLDGRLGPGELRIMGFGLAAAIVIYAIPFTRFIFSILVTLFHELGHAIMGWLLGHASIPAFDFMYGGGLTHYGIFRRSIAFAVALGFAYLAYLFRHNKKSMAIIGAVFLVWLFIVTKEWRRETAMAAGGHLTEFILAAIFFYKALAGVGWRNPELERPLGAFMAFFVQIHSTLWTWRLLNDDGVMDEYRRGKGGALMNDLEVIAVNLQIYLGYNPGIDGVARWLLLFSVLPTAVALVWYFERARWHRVLRSLRTVDA
jgi:hypothetical protein